MLIYRAACGEQEANTETLGIGKKDIKNADGRVLRGSDIIYVGQKLDVPQCAPHPHLHPFAWRFLQLSHAMSMCACAQRKSDLEFRGHRTPTSQTVASVPAQSDAIPPAGTPWSTIGLVSAPPDSCPAVVASLEMV